MSRGILCEAHKHSGPVAQERHHLRPQSRGGKTFPANMRWLCANAHGDAHYLLDLIEDQAVVCIGQPVELLWPYEIIPYATRRTFGAGIRDAALTGWQLYAAQFLAGDYSAHRMLWSSSGAPRNSQRAVIGGPALSYEVASAAGRAHRMLTVAAEHGAGRKAQA